MERLITSFLDGKPLTQEDIGILKEDEHRVPSPQTTEVGN